MNIDRDRKTDTPAGYSTARRPGQPGEENEHRAGPNPRSAHPTGPHAPYEPRDSEGLAAEKHHSGTVEIGGGEVPEREPSGTIKVIDLKKPG
ncbi:hypothetical protein [Bosea sp. NBC_00550]|jgi:hypothetical protein|uniref:hypothetical protein n=1 Tax=Bosea sp. NBC_00550 TaxID=2969621 RepID=UPI00222F609A|nr:hypothetical protein [Bosea sp. NBC_00550]UZF90770.1 hypothetical protein NWE53_16685 [Bosea sp. NBC_00550]